jgi:hypothetical protein
MHKKIVEVLSLAELHVKEAIKPKKKKSRQEQPEPESSAPRAKSIEKGWGK